ncbi:transcription initiation factor TFIID subunit 12-like isoform X2 [Malus sylvestris]|uniref:transcription initiation factor TFIID subunit 12-like isoform X2 n=1 Tax=Malus sylvestris TaxID=3752 RepID=UPI0010AA28F1|nr:transcription initiation factor TFIID subunit 12-like isoform X2 [Malus domestica]XP_050123396.1 transcription initiation factor TFIID subunit 12-like isoform X2 [Malus sylvestris]
MDQQNSTTTPTPSASQPSIEPPPTAQSQPPPQPQPPPSSSLTTTPTSTPSPPSPNPNPKPSTPLPPQPLHQPQPPPQSLPPPSQPRPPSTLTRPPWQQQSHFHQYPSPSSSASSGPPPPPSPSQPPPPRGGIAIGVSAHHTGPSTPQPTPYSSSYGHHFGGMGRGGVSVPEPVSNSSPSQNFQGHSLLRVSSVGSASSSPNASQGLQPHTQPWLSSGPQGKPPIPSPSYRQQMNSPSMQQRSHLPQQQQQSHPHPTASQQQHHPMPSAPQQQHHPLPSASQQQHHSLPSASPQQPLPSASQQQHTSSVQQVQQSRVPQTTPRQQQITRVQGPVNPKSSTLVAAQPNTVQSGAQNKTLSPEIDESCNRILGKRSIRELVNQIDPSEMLDPEVEEILMDIADEFVDSITTFSCSLAKHRKSTQLEAKDILLHIEKNWNITLPGFGGDEIKGFRKPLTNDIHKERLAVIKKSIVATETANARNPTGQAAGNAKGSLVKTPANIISSLNSKMREVT